MLLNTKIWDQLAKYHYPAKSGLDFFNEFTFLVGIVLSAQSRDAFINTITPEFFKKAPDAESMYALGLEEIAFHIQKIGLWRAKAKYIYNLSKKILEFKKIMKNGETKSWLSSIKADGDDVLAYSDPISKEGIPSFRAGLMLLPGIGRKGANVFLNVIYNAPTYPVDTHVIRVGSRLQLAIGNNPLQIEKMMQETVPEKYSKVASHWLVWHGREVCLARKPKCDNCLLKQSCSYYIKTL